MCDHCARRPESGNIRRGSGSLSALRHPRFRTYKQRAAESAARPREPLETARYSTQDAGEQARGYSTRCSAGLSYRRTIVFLTGFEPASLSSRRSNPSLHCPHPESCGRTVGYGVVFVIRSSRTLHYPHSVENFPGEKGRIRRFVSVLARMKYPYSALLPEELFLMDQSVDCGEYCRVICAAKRSRPSPQPPRI